MAGKKKNKKISNVGLAGKSAETDRLKTSMGALKANLEGNEAVMDRVLRELKDVKKKLDLLRGAEEIINLREEAREELIEIKKVEAAIHADADKAETIYSELKGKFQEIDMFSGSLSEIMASLEQGAGDIAFLKTKISGLVDKNELKELTNKVQGHIDTLRDVNKTSSLQKDLIQLKTLLEGIK